MTVIVTSMRFYFLLIDVHYKLAVFFFFYLLENNSTHYSVYNFWKEFRAAFPVLCFNSVPGQAKYRVPILDCYC